MGARMGRPYVIQPQTFLFACPDTENKIHLFIKKLKIGDFVDFPFFPMFSSPYLRCYRTHHPLEIARLPPWGVLARA